MFVFILTYRCQRPRHPRRFGDRHLEMQPQVRQCGVDHLCQLIDTAEEPFAAGEVEEQGIGRFDRHHGAEADHPAGQAMQGLQILLRVMFLMGQTGAQCPGLGEGHAGGDAGLFGFIGYEDHELVGGDGADQHQGLEIRIPKPETRLKIRIPKPEIRMKSQIRMPE